MPGLNQATRDKARADCGRCRRRAATVTVTPLRDNAWTDSGRATRTKTSPRAGRTQAIRRTGDKACPARPGRGGLIQAT